MVDDTLENRNRCICPHCPSYPNNCGGEVLYCALGHSMCEIGVKGCLCPGCPVYLENNLRTVYFCDKSRIGESPLNIRRKKPEENSEFYDEIIAIKEMAASGESAVVSMGSKKKMPFSLDDLHFIPAQVSAIPLNEEEKVNLGVVIGPASNKPMKVSSPILISGMSFGSVSKNVKLAIAKGSKELDIAYNSGEGGVLPEEPEIDAKLIRQYSTGKFGITEKVLKEAKAIEIRFGQGAYPGKGSFLPAAKMSKEVAELRGLAIGEPAYSPAHHADMKTPKKIEEKILWLKELTGGVPIGAKIGCGNIEEDVHLLASCGVDFISLDGFGAGTGATEGFVRENVGLPIWAALPRAYKCLMEAGVKNKVTLIAGGGLRTSADIAKCLALGADAVYIGTAALIAINCQQYRLCHTGLCPTGVTTQNPTLTKQLDSIDASAQRLRNFISALNSEIAALTRITGKDDIRKLDNDDLVSMKKDLAQLVGVQWLDGGELPEELPGGEE